MKPEGMLEFNVAKYMGTWYEYARYNSWYEYGCKGSEANYTLNDDGTVNILNKCKRFLLRNTASGLATQVYPGVGTFGVTFFPFMWGSYIVLYTDYRNVAYVTTENSDYFWVLVRDKSVSKILQDRIHKDLRYYSDTGLVDMNKLHTFMAQAE